MMLAAGCTADSSPEPQPTPSESVEASLDLTFADLGIDGWPDAEDPQIPEFPGVAGTFDDATAEKYATYLKTWALQAALDPDAVGDGLPEPLTQTLASFGDSSTSADLARGNVLGEGLEVTGTKMTAAWGVDFVAGQEQLRLQTRTAYQVVDANGDTRVIGVLRLHGFDLTAAQPDSPGVLGAWQEFGASDCSLALDDVLLPGTDLDAEERDLQTFVAVGRSKEPTMPELSKEDRVDDDFLANCRAGRV